MYKTTAPLARVVQTRLEGRRLCNLEPSCSLSAGAPKPVVMAEPFRGAQTPTRRVVLDNCETNLEFVSDDRIRFQTYKRVENPNQAALSAAAKRRAAPESYTKRQLPG